MQDVYAGKTVLVTGHTGFKGSWLSLWLRQMGAHVVGYSLDPPTKPSNFQLTNLKDKITHVTGDVRDLARLKAVIAEHRPEIIFHLAAQAIVLHSFAFPRETFEINAMGSVNILEAARFSTSVKAIVMVATDKCYENKEWIWGYRENDPLGGDDPYSASKAMAEMAIQAYRASFFKSGSPAIASARSGNVIGGGDFSDHRVLPDTFKALIAGKQVGVRQPQGIRPWLYVLDPLAGYLLLGKRLLEGGHDYAQPWNFGPVEQQGIPVRAIVEKAIELWGNGSWAPTRKRADKPEKHLLRLNWDKAAHGLGWKPLYTWEEAVEATVEWYKAYAEKCDLYEVCADQINNYHSRLEAACATSRPPSPVSI